MGRVLSEGPSSRCRCAKAGRCSAVESSEPRSVLPDTVGIACASLQPCVYVCVPTRVYMEQNIHVGLYVCMYIATYILSVCVWVCVRELFKSKTCTKTIWLNLSLRSEAYLRVFCQP